AARGLDYLELDPAVDAKHVSIEGVSRFGKAALVTMAFDQRFAMVLVGSSGKGGATLLRRNFGKAVENLTGGEYYCMAGNFMKYGASDAVFGSKNAGNLPVDSHELIALCAPRLTFISYGLPEKRRQVARPARKLHGGGGREPCIQPARGKGAGHLRAQRQDAGGECRPARRAACLAAARRRTHRRAQHEILSEMGRRIH